eukprot:250999_1
MTLELIGIIGEIIAVSLFVICAIAAINGNVKLYRISNAMFIQKRHKSIVFGLNTVLIFEMLSIVVGHWISLTGSEIPIVSLIANIFTVICYWSFFYFSIGKNWMIYYKERWTFHTLQLEWQQIINKTNNDNNNWFIKNNSKYGSLSYVYKIFGIYYVIGIILGIIGMIEVSSPNPNLLFVAPLIAMPLLVVVVFYVTIICKTTHLALIDDIFFIHWESKMHVRVISFGMIIVFVQYAFGILISNRKGLSAAIFNPIYVVILYVLIHISTYSIYTRNYHTDETSQQEQFTNRSQSQISISNRSQSPISTFTKIKLHHILSNENSIHLYMIHLSKEYSMECLLAFLEISQYQQYVIKQNILNDKSVDFTNYKNIDFPSNIPLSSIIECNNDNDKDAIHDLKIKAHKIYCKYIKTNCEFEINISYTQREMFTNIFDNLEF